MAKFIIPLNVFASADIEVEAENIKEAISIINKRIKEDWKFGREGREIKNLDIAEYQVNEELLKEEN